MVDPTFKDEYIPVSVITKAYKVKKGKKCEKIVKNIQILTNRARNCMECQGNIRLNIPECINTIFCHNNSTYKSKR